MPPKFFARARVVQLLLYSPFSFHFFLHIHSFYVFFCIYILNLQSSFILYSLFIILALQYILFNSLALYNYFIYFPCSLHSCHLFSLLFTFQIIYFSCRLNYYLYFRAKKKFIIFIFLFEGSSVFLYTCSWVYANCEGVYLLHIDILNPTDLKEKLTLHLGEFLYSKSIW